MRLPTSRLVALGLLVTLVATDPAWARRAELAAPDPHQLRLRRRAARIERGAGLGLAAVGFAACAAGGALLGISGQASYEQGSIYQTSGALAMGVGALLLIPGGVSLAIAGQGTLTDASWRLRLLAGTFVVPARGGVIAGLGFRF